MNIQPCFELLRHLTGKAAFGVDPPVRSGLKFLNSPRQLPDARTDRILAIVEDKSQAFFIAIGKIPVGLESVIEEGVNILILFFSKRSVFAVDELHRVFRDQQARRQM
jgi:hypothetical protein